jgi:hypothetical protein
MAHASQLPPGGLTRGYQRIAIVVSLLFATSPQAHAAGFFDFLFGPSSFEMPWWKTGARRLPVDHHKSTAHHRSTARESVAAAKLKQPADEPQAATAIFPPPAKLMQSP